LSPLAAGLEVRGITLLINGGTRQLDARRAATERSLAALARMAWLV
jgi:hypothetical protein